MCASRRAICHWIQALSLAAVICGVCGPVPVPPLVGAEIVTAKNPAAGKARKAPWGVPFTAADVVRYFTDALQSCPTTTRQGYTVFENRNAATPEEQYRIVIQQENGEVMVYFSVGGNYGMNFAREFFECPLFRRNESERLYILLNEAAKAPVMPMERFSVSARLWETPDRVHLVLRFFHPKKPVVL